MNSLENLSASMLPAIEEELRRAIALTDRPGLGELYSMLAYHLGWEVEGARPAASGKRIRPFLTLLVASAAGGDWNCALPAAAAIELIHNFSLIHDDIEDRSPLRRGRPAVWQKWGIAQAINTGDTMFTLAHLALLRLEETTTPQIALKAARILQETALRLTEGQHLDIAYETRPDLQPDGYWSMIGGKTAALLSASAEIGALSARASAPVRESYRKFGNDLGLAFQVQDDLLGIWGNIEVTGKSIQSDLLTGKKSLPVLYGLSLGGPFARRWLKGSILPEEVPALARQLEEEGARLYAQDHANRLTGQSLLALKQANPQGEAGQALTELAEQLLNRKF